ncbi:MAG: oligosaccharide flippase family protein [Candidatus Marinimicrobia bacterium]|jgi:O-antigen/teichoic acid export membrane protein|nr:oligosaccharide flippase family protein [Candidatus Neomarinimicrobiota bacterium]MDP6593879.1 oligosaccharide flippase family protein [Candidatus Neomarinimicrobiota bacterium]MDP6835884.1 oligosaccharide flippase family protein [Candidatus Neomarinimicrobiota bacterium]MDP6966432.1 oligosaccharide flippase family protein [Candidatus Neomarinimicrobiota bacterium]|tara:strand:- start:7955 stop:9358 length:1404 start_codon:yes stop_codon:yes gene_type:complete
MKQLSKNIISLTTADVASRLLGFVSVAYLARTLGPSDMGVLAVGMAVLAYGAIFADAGLPILGTRIVAAQQIAHRTVSREIRTARLFLSIISVFLGCVIFFIFEKRSDIQTVTCLYLMALLPSALLLDWFFQGISDMLTLSKARVLGMAVYLAAVISFVREGAHLMWVPTAWFTGTAAQAWYLWSSYKKISPDDVKSSEPSGIFKLIRQGIPLGLATLISQVVIQFPLIYLGLFDKTENAGFYNVAFRVIVLLLVVDRVFYTMFFPAISRSFREDRQRLPQKVEQTIKLITAGVLYIAILAILAGDTLFPLLFGQAFEQSSMIFQTLIVYFILTVLNSIFSFTLIGIEREKSYTRSLMIGAVGFFAFMSLPIPLPSTLLAPLALALFQALSMIVMSRELQDTLAISSFGRILLTIVITVALTAVFSAWANSSPLIATVGAVIISPFILAWSAGVNQEDIKFLRKVII